MLAVYEGEWVHEQGLACFFFNPLLLFLNKDFEIFCFLHDSTY